MPPTVISIEGVGKRYSLSRQGHPGGSLRQLAEEALRAPFRLLGGGGGEAAPRDDAFWALRDVSFEVGHGEVVGIVGRNGAGKSTLLKILSRITEPTEGRIHIAGRVANLLEVGTGFHPELTGRENVFLNGAILGMSRAEIRAKFDEIVAFSEVEQFIDTPVKRYSSGMYVRLAFAVAAHLEPEILIVDEVLAVGDMAFQRKCLGRLRTFSGREGRTVLFVSHNFAALESLCTRGILLERGRVEAAGPISEVLRGYSARSAAVSGGLADFAGRTESRSGPREYAELRRFAMLDAEGRPCSSTAMGRPVRFVVEVDFKRPGEDFEVAVSIANLNNVTIHTFISNWEGLPAVDAPGVRRIAIDVPRLALFPGTYQIAASVKLQGQQVDDNVREILTFESVEAQFTGHYAYFGRYSQNSQTHIENRWRFLEGGGGGA